MGFWQARGGVASGGGGASSQPLCTPVVWVPVVEVEVEVALSELELEPDADPDPSAEPEAADVPGPQAVTNPNAASNSKRNQVRSSMRPR